MEIALNSEIERNLGEQPLAKIMAKHELTANDLVMSSKEQITHKMVRRAMKGRRLTANVQGKLLAALRTKTDRNYELADLFNY